MATTTKTRRRAASVIAELLEIDATLIEDERETFPGITEARVLVGPLDAARLLERNIAGNRNVKSAKVAQFARAMAADAFDSAHAKGLTFTVDGELIDGQHTLAAIVASGVDLVLRVMTGAAAAAVEVIDTGSPRSAADALRMRGCPSASDAASIARFYLQQTSGRGQALNPSNHEVVEWVEQRDDLITLNRYARQVNNATRLQRTAFAVLLLRAVDAGASEADIEEFVEELKTGIDGEGRTIASDSAVYVLREWAFRQARLPRGREHATPLYTFRVTTKAWNAWLRNEPVKQLKFRRDEDPPEIIGEDG